MPNVSPLLSVTAETLARFPPVRLFHTDVSALRHLSDFLKPLAGSPYTPGCTSPPTSLRITRVMGRGLSVEYPLSYRSLPAYVTAGPHSDGSLPLCSLVNPNLERYDRCGCFTPLALAAFPGAHRSGFVRKALGCRLPRLELNTARRAGMHS